MSDANKPGVLPGYVKRITIEISGSAEDQDRVDKYAAVIVSEIKNVSSLMSMVQESNQKADPSLKPISLQVYES